MDVYPALLPVLGIHIRYVGVEVRHHSTFLVNENTK